MGEIVAAVIRIHYLSMALVKKGKSPSDRADMHGLPKAVENQNRVIQRTRG